jgi:cytochrome P450
MRVALDGPGKSDVTSSGLYDESQYSTRDMHAVWQVLREAGNLHHEQTPDGEKFFAAMRYADVREVLGDYGTFSSAYSTMLSVRGDGDVAAGAAIHLTDPPLHSEIKRIFTPLMTVRAMRGFQHGITQRMSELFETIRSKESFDFCEAMITLPMTVTGTLMGIPESAWPVTGRATVQAMGGAEVAEPEYQRRYSLFEAHTTIMTVLGEALEAQPPDNSVSGRCLVTASVVDDPARDVPLLNAYAFLMGANPTIPQTINQTLILLASDDELWSWFTGQEQTDQRFIDEALRWASPINHVLRRTTADTTLAGTELPAGSLVTAWLGSANRDEEVFVKPYSFIPDRPSNQHLAFGLGVHRCIGQHIAIAGMKTFFDLWRDNVRSMSLSGEPKHLVSSFLNGVVCLPLEVDWK